MTISTDFQDFCPISYSPIKNEYCNIKNNRNILQTNQQYASGQLNIRKNI